MRRVYLGLALVLFGSAGCADPVQGELRLSGRDGRALVIEPRECYDGAPLGFLGVELRDVDRTVEFFDEGGEPGVIVHVPGDVAFELLPEDCATFAGELVRDFNPVTNVGKVSGDVTLDCTSLDGWDVQGAISFDECWAEDDDEDDCWDCTW